jgi:hypothetical protein
MQQPHVRGCETGKRKRDWMNWLRGIWKSRYVELLEEENARLKAENRAFLNSLLGTAGFPPVDFPEAGKTEFARLRKRSWPQIQRMREAEMEK